MIEAEINRMSWASGETAAVSKKIHENGIMTQHMLVASNPSNVITLKVEIFGDASSTTPLYSLAGIPRNAHTLTENLSVPIQKGFTIKITPSGDPGANGITADPTLYLEQK